METPEQVSLLDYLSILKKRKRTVLFIFILSVLLTGLLSKLVLPPTYEATTTLIFPQPEPTASTVFLSTSSGELGKVAGLAGLGGAREPTAPYVAILKSQNIAERAVYKFDLERRYKADTFQQAVKTLRRDVKAEATKEGLVQLTVAFRGPSPLAFWLSHPRAAQDPSGDARQLAADVANFYINALSEFTQREVFLHTATKYRAYLEGQLDKSREQLRVAEEALRAFKEKNRLVSLPEEVKGALENVAKLEADKILTDSRLKEVEARVKAITQQILEQTKAPLENVPAHSPFVQELRNKLISQEADLAVATQEYGPSHPKAIRLNMELEETKKQLNDELRRVLSSVKSKLAPELIEWEQERIATSAKSAAEGKILSDLKARGGSVPAKEAELTRLTREVEVLSQVYALLSQETEKAKMSEAREVITYQVLDKAEPPDRKIRPRTTLNIAVAAILALFVGASWALLAEYAQKSTAAEP